VLSTDLLEITRIKYIYELEPPMKCL